MKTLSAPLLSLIVLATCANAVAQGTSSAAPVATTPQPVLAVGISPVRDSVSTKNEVVVNVKYTNASDHPLSLTCSMGLGLDIDVRDASGKRAPETDFARLYDPSVNDTQKFDIIKAHPNYLNNDHQASAVLAPGESWSWRLFVTRFYDMHQPGKYTIQTQEHDRENRLLMIKSNTVTVTVTP
jgi:hypothetical protein